MLSRLRSWLDGLGRDGADAGGRADAEPAETDGAAETDPRPDGGGTHAPDVATIEDVVEHGRLSKHEILVTLGLQPDEFLVRLLDHSGGRMWQGDIVETTGWSESTVSRHLGGLEADGRIRRIQIGRRKLVGLPGQMPEGAAVPDTPSPERPGGGAPSETDEPA